MMAEHVEGSRKAIPETSKVWEHFENKTAKRDVQAFKHSCHFMAALQPGMST